MGIFWWGFALQGRAQNETDVLRYSWVDPLGSTRVMGMGGSFGALGADLGCLGINPSGLGMYRRGDLSVTAGLHAASTTAQWNTRQEEATGFASTISNVGIALTYPSVDADWPFFTVAFSHQNRMPFAQKVSVNGVPSESSLSALFVGQALDDAAIYGYESTDDALDNGDIFAYGASLAWRSGLLVPDNDELYASSVEGPVNVQRTIDRTGRMAETQIAFATAYQNKIYLGVTLGLPKVQFEERSVHQETPVASGSELGQWRFEEQLDIEGRGTLVRVGVLARVTKALRVGLAYQSRSRMTLLDTYSTTVRTSWLDGTEGAASSPISNIEYLVFTPSRLTASASFLMGKMGVVNADYVRSDMRNGELGDANTFLSSGYEYEAENLAVDNGYQVVHAGRAGLELRVGDAKQGRIRLGGGMTTSPFAGDAVYANATRYHASVGAGYRVGNVHFSAAWRRAWHQEDYYFMGAFSDEAPGTLDRRASALVVGAGLRL